MQTIKVKRLVHENAVNPNVKRPIIGLKDLILSKIKDNRIYAIFRPDGYDQFRELSNYLSFTVTDMIGYATDVDDETITIAVAYGDALGRIPVLLEHPEQFRAEIVSKLSDSGELVDIIAVWIEREKDGVVVETI